MSSSIRRTLSILHRGVETVQLALESPEYGGLGYERVARLVDASRRITWAYEENGNLYATEDGALTDVQVAVIAGPVPSGLDSNSTFQTQEGDDGITRVYVRRHPYTSTWAGIVLFHELDHVLDHRDGVWPSVPTTEDWWDAEARAYHREALVINAVAGGRLLPTLTDLVRGRSVDQLLSEQLSDFDNDLYRRAFPAQNRQPPGSDHERWARSASLKIAAVVAAVAQPTSLADLPTSSAGPQVRQAASFWGWGSAVS